MRYYCGQGLPVSLSFLLATQLRIMSSSIAWGGLPERCYGRAFRSAKGGETPGSAVL